MGHFIHSLSLCPPGTYLASVYKSVPKSGEIGAVNLAEAGWWGVWRRREERMEPK